MSQWVGTRGGGAALSTGLSGTRDRGVVVFESRS